jgi:ribosomal protein L11 methyltransferase
MPWLAVTLKIDAEAAEALSEALLEAGADSVLLDHPDAPRVELKALCSPQLDAAALLGAASAACGLAPPAFAVERIEDQDWVRRTQSQFAPLRVGERLWVGPSWHKPPADVAAVTLDPGLAFGTGSHPTTRLVLRFLERCVAGGERVLDYGCGSGILAIAAAKLGAGRVSATDIDPGAVETANANAVANRVALDLSVPQDLDPGLFDIVVANILAQPLIVLAPLLAARTAPGGRIALSGILESQAAEVAAAYAAWFDVAPSQTEEGWALVEGTLRGAPR